MQVLQATGYARMAKPFGLAFEHICELQNLSLEQLREPSIAMNVIVMTARCHDYLDSVLEG